MYTTLMQDYSIFEHQDLDRIALVCPFCKTEAVFDLNSEQTALRPRHCPACEAELLGTFQRGGKQYNLVTLYKEMRDHKPMIDNKPVEIRLYFKKSESA
jgi:predicted amidophosphoribosyltransferase